MLMRTAVPRFTADDHARLLALLADARSSAGAGALAGRLACASLCDPLPTGVARLGSKLAYHDDRAGRKRKGRLVVPAEASVYDGLISVCSPVGAALVGLREGQAIDCLDRAGRRRLTLLWVEA